MLGPVTQVVRRLQSATTDIPVNNAVSRNDRDVARVMLVGQGGRRADGRTHLQAAHEGALGVVGHDEGAGLLLQHHAVEHRHVGVVQLRHDVCLPPQVGHQLGCALPHLSQAAGGVWCSFLGHMGSTEVEALWVGLEFELVGSWVGWRGVCEVHGE